MIKKLITIMGWILFAGTAYAQPPYPQMNGQDMQKMMQAAQKMQQCMSQVNESELQALENEMTKMQTEIESLCKAGKRDEAQRLAMKMAMKSINDPTLKQMQECGKIMQGIMPMMARYPAIEAAKQSSKAEKSQHICDQLH